MKFIYKTLLAASLLLNTINVSAQENKNDITVQSQPWKAYWIAAPKDEGRDYGVYYFRKTLTLAARPASFKVKVSADNRYKLFVNGTLVSLGPARGDTYYWNYETVDLSPWLVQG